MSDSHRRECVPIKKRFLCLNQLSIQLIISPPYVGTELVVCQSFPGQQRLFRLDKIKITSSSCSFSKPYLLNCEQPCDSDVFIPALSARQLNITDPCLTLIVQIRNCLRVVTRHLNNTKIIFNFNMTEFLINRGNDSKFTAVNNRA